MKLCLGELAERIGADLRGDPERVVERLATLQRAVPGEVSFLANARYRRYLSGTRASAVILSPRVSEACPVDVLLMENPYLGYARAAAVLNPQPKPPRGRHPNAWISPEARVHGFAWVGPQAVVEAGASVAAGAYIGPGCVVGADALVGEDCWLVANVTLCHGVRLGRRVQVHPGAVIGADGFGLAEDQGRWVKIPQLGSVVIGDDVEIGANTTVDRGALEDTVIEAGAKLDNLVQVGHNCRIGEHTAVAGATGIAGSVSIGRRCRIGGGVGINGHIELTDDVHVTGRSVVAQSIVEPGVYSSGVPLQETRAWRRNYLRYRQLDELARRLKRLEKESN